MTRFDADDARERQRLFADAIAAHRNRDSAFCTFEVDAAHASEDDDFGAPWLQYTDDDGVVNLDCTAAEHDRILGVLDDFPAFKVRELNDPEDAPGKNVRIGALADANRIAQFTERVFRDAYELPEDYRVWAATV